MLLEGRIQARQAKREAIKAVSEAVGHEPTTSDKMKYAKMATKDEIHSAGDKLEQVKLEAKMQARHAKAAILQSDAKQAVDNAAIATGDALVDAKDAVVSSLSSAPDVVEPAVAPSGVDISHIEGGANAQLAAEDDKLRQRTHRDEQREAQQKRRELVADAESAASAVSGKVKSAVDQAGIAIGSAALSAKDKLDAYTDNGPDAQVSSRVSSSGVDISSAENPRNPDLRAQDARIQEIEKSNQPTILESAQAGISHAVDSVKDAYTSATSSAPQPIYVQKTSSHGIDISHLENAANTALAAKELEQIKADKTAAAAHDKAVVEAKLVDPLREDGSALKDRVAAGGATLGSKLSSLGSSIAHAAHDLGDKIVSTWHPHDQTQPIIDAANTQRLNQPTAGEDAPESAAAIGHSLERAAKTACYQSKIAAAEADIAAHDPHAIPLKSSAHSDDVSKDVPSPDGVSSKEALSPHGEPIERPGFVRVRTPPLLPGSPTHAASFQTFRANQP